MVIFKQWWYCSNNGGGPNSHFTTLQMFSQERVFDNVQISTTFRCVVLLASPREHVLLRGIFDKTRLSIHSQNCLCVCKSSPGREAHIASRSVHGRGGGGVAGGDDAIHGNCDASNAG